MSRPNHDGGTGQCGKYKSLWSRGKVQDWRNLQPRIPPPARKKDSPEILLLTALLWL